jgi:phosphate butyryltransferase
MLEMAANLGPALIAVAGADEHEILSTVSVAQARGLVNSTLLGDAGRIRETARRHDIDLSAMEIVGVSGPEEAAERTMRLVATGQAHLAVKGKVRTSVFLHAALRRETGLRTGQLLSHVGIFEIPDCKRLLFITDGGVVLFPTREQKVQIVHNAIGVAKAFGITQPRVALLAASDRVSEEMPVTLEIVTLVGMKSRWQEEGAVLDGPFLLDSAVSEMIAQSRGRGGPVAGQADVLVAPNVESGNIMAKAITYFAGGRMAGLVVGAKAPLVVGSRSDPPETRLVSIAAGVLQAAHGQTRPR